jgi:hypothetical protein
MPAASSAGGEGARVHIESTAHECPQFSRFVIAVTALQRRLQHGLLATADGRRGSKGSYAMHNDEMIRELTDVELDETSGGKGLPYESSWMTQDMQFAVLWAQIAAVRSS